MKKMFGVFGVTLIVGFIVVLMSACSVSTAALCEKNISEYRQNLFLGEGENFTSSFTTGKREKTYAYDGKATELVDFGVLVVKFNTPYIGLLPTYTLYIDTLQYSGDMEFNPFDGTYVADVAKEFTSEADIALLLHAGSINENIDMPCVSSQFDINYKEAFNIAINDMESKITPHIKNGALLGEFFIKLVGDTSDTKKVYYYIYFVPESGEGAVCLIDTEGNIITAA